jgi:hypothetical protein
MFFLFNTSQLITIFSYINKFLFILFKNVNYTFVDSTLGNTYNLKNFDKLLPF